MKEFKYGKIRRILKRAYFTPDEDSKSRLLNKLHINRNENFYEHRFITKFRIALVAMVTLICLLNINSVNPHYLNRYNSENIIALGDLITGREN